MLFHEYLLAMAAGKDDGSGPSTCSKAALALREETLLQVAEQTIEEDTG